VSIGKNHLICGLLAVLILLTTVIGGSVRASTPYLGYTYDYFGRRVPSPQAYLPPRVIRGSHLGIGDFRNPADLFVSDRDFLYIVDTGNNRIVCIDRDLNVVRVIDRLSNEGRADRFNRPRGMFVADDGSIYVADTENSRVVQIDADGNVLSVIADPKSTEEGVIPEGFVFKPICVVVSPLGSRFVLAANVYDGIMEFDSEGVFRGFIGAPRVTPSVADVLWSRLATREQRERLALFLPANYRTLDIDDKGFLYATERNIIKRLSPNGINVLVEQGFFPPQGDLVEYQDTPSDFVDILARPAGMYSVLDRTSGRVFTYDRRGNLLYVFGGLGHAVGTFAVPAAIEQWMGNMIVLDQQLNEIVVFEPTEYVQLIHRAIYHYSIGQTDLSVKAWQAVLERNANYDLAYSGIGRALLLADDYTQAMVNFRNGNDRNGYSDAFKELRKEVIAQNLGWVLTALIIVSVLVYVLVKWSASQSFVRLRETVFRPIARRFEFVWTKMPVSVKSTLNGLSYSVFVMFHPAEGFYALKHERRGNIASAFLLVALETGAYVFIRQYAGFLFNEVDISRFSALAEAARVVVPFILWCWVNWCLTTLLDGKGSMHDIVVSTAYALAPLVVVLVPATMLSNCLILEEAFLYQLVLAAGASWAGVLLLSGTLITHDYTLNKTILTSVLTVIGIGVVVFIGMLLYVVVSQVAVFVSDIYTEVTFRL
jgi:tetratricopeptide (TPR) repeat protein